MFSPSVEMGMCSEVGPAKTTEQPLILITGFDYQYKGDLRVESKHPCGTAQHKTV